MSRQNLHSLHGISNNEEEPSLGEYVFCQECEDFVHEHCFIHDPQLVVPNSKKEERSKSPQMLFSVQVKVESLNSDNAIERDQDSINPITNSSEASGKYPDEKLTNLLAMLEECSSSNLMDTNNNKETHTYPLSFSNITEDDIDDVELLDGNSDFEHCEKALNSEIIVKKDSDIKKFQAQLDEEIMRDLEAGAKIFEAIQVSKGYRLMIAQESFEKKSEEDRSISKRTELIAKNEDMCESGLIIIDSGVEDIAAINDSVSEGTENDFHTDIVNARNAMDYIDDGAEDITQRYEMRDRLVKEMLVSENLCQKQFEEEQKNNPHTSTSTQIAPKSKRKLQTTKKSTTTKKPKFQNNDVDARETGLKSETNMKKNTSVTKKQKFQEPIFKNVVDKNSKRKSKETNMCVVPSGFKNIQEGNIDGGKTPVINKNTAKFECNECGKKFSTKHILTDHILKCIKPKTLVNGSQLQKADTLNSFPSEMYSCDICTFNTNNKRYIESHLKMHGVIKVLCCNICEYRSTIKSNLENHMRTHTGEKSFACYICEFICAKKGYLIRHIRTHTGEKPFGCNICDYRCAQKGTLKLHIKTHTGEKPYACNICDYRCTQKGTLKDHIKTHTGEKPYACNICDYRCTQKGNLKTHIKYHAGEKPYACNICDYRCTQKGNLKTHIKYHAGEKPYACNICDYRCTQKGNLKTHIKTHAGEKPYACNICDYRCTQKGNLKTHIKYHAGEKPYACNICDYRCTQKGTLKDHIKTHTGEKPYACNICDYRCTQKGNLKTHIKTHAGEKPYACNICDYRCTQKGNLKTHIKTHAGEKPYACNICDYRCTQKGNLKTHTGEKPYACNICDYRCTQKGNLKTHKNTCW